MKPRDETVHASLLAHLCDRIERASGLTQDQLLSQGRVVTVLRWRHALTILLRERGLTAMEIARLMGRNHTTVLNSFDRADHPEVVACVARINATPDVSGQNSAMGFALRTLRPRLRTVLPEQDERCVVHYLRSCVFDVTPGGVRASYGLLTLARNGRALAMTLAALQRAGCAEAMRTLDLQLARVRAA